MATDIHKGGGNMLNCYKDEKRNGRTMMEKWKKCYQENLQVQNDMINKAKTKEGYNPVRDKFNSPQKDLKYVQERNRFHAGKKMNKNPKSRYLRI